MLDQHFYRLEAALCEVVELNHKLSAVTAERLIERCKDIIILLDALRDDSYPVEEEALPSSSRPGSVGLGAVHGGHKSYIVCCAEDAGSSASSIESRETEGSGSGGWMQLSAPKLQSVH